MSRFRRSPDTNSRNVLEALEASGLEKESTLILGGAVLALLGIRDAEDVDVMVPGTVFEDLRLSGRTPGGLYTIGKAFAQHPFLEARSTPIRETPLPIDITHPYGSNNRPNVTLDARFLQAVKKFDKVEGYSLLPLDDIIAHKQQLKRWKDKADVKLIQHYRND